MTLHAGPWVYNRSGQLPPERRDILQNMPLCVPNTPSQLLPFPQSGATVSTALSTTAFTLSLSTLLAHSTSSVSNHTLTTCLSTLISTPGTGIPMLCNLSSSSASRSSRTLSSTSASGSFLMPSSSSAGFGGLGNTFGLAIGVTRGPNWASRNMQRREKRSSAVTFEWGLRSA